MSLSYRVALFLCRTVVVCDMTGKDPRLSLFQLREGSLDKMKKSLMRKKEGDPWSDMYIYKEALACSYKMFLIIFLRPRARLFFWLSQMINFKRTDAEPMFL